MMFDHNDFNELITRYGTQGPRYTSYPTAPNWGTHVGNNDYLDYLGKCGQNSQPLSLYFHMPFCHELCWFCACHKMIRPVHGAHEDRYIAALSHEVNRTAEALVNRKKVVQIQLGGGTPTYFNNERLGQLMDVVHKRFDVASDAEIAIESTLLSKEFHGDPADRIIWATARKIGATLITYDKEILAYSKKHGLPAMSL